MAAASLVYGGGSEFYPDLFTVSTIPSGAAAGTIFTFSPPVGKRIRVTLMYAVSAAQPNISLSFSGVKVINNQTLGNPSATGGGPFKIGFTGSSNFFSWISYIDGRTNQPLTITKEAAGATSTDIIIVYAYGD